MNNEDGFYVEIPEYFCKICNCRIYPQEMDSHREKHSNPKPRELYESVKNMVVKRRYDYHARPDLRQGYSIHYGIPTYDARENEVRIMRIAVIDIDESHDSASICLDTTYNVGYIYAKEENDNIEFIDFATMLRELDLGFAKLRNMVGPVYEKEVKNNGIEQ